MYNNKGVPYPILKKPVLPTDLVYLITHYNSKRKQNNAGNRTDEDTGLVVASGTSELSRYTSGRVTRRCWHRDHTSGRHRVRYNRRGPSLHHEATSWIWRLS
jgi:hypothetical protein